MAQDTETDDNSVATSGWAVVKQDDRRDNLLKLEPPDASDIFYFSRQDCLDDITFDLVVTLTGSALDVSNDLFIYRGADCDTEDLTTCDMVKQKPPNGATTVRFDDLTVREFFGVDQCADTGGDTYRFWLAMLKDRDEFDDVNGNDFIMSIGSGTVDYVGLNVEVEIEDILVGSSNIEIKFKQQNNDNIKGFVAFYAESAETDCSDGLFVAGEYPDAAIIDGSKSTDSSDETSIKISGLDDGTYYQVAVSALDEYGNPSNFSEPRCSTPQESVGIGDAIDTDGEFCFIATAAFGSYDHPTVKVLRVFRDQFLRELPLGDAIVAGYYAVGPSLAAWVKPHSETQSVLQSTLSLFAGASILLVQWGAWWVLLAFWCAMVLGVVLGIISPARAKEK
ncbi:MAG: fibronectin type III domain-containing protein [Deltaproteobacteria bacterium]|nr:fibronectin type III domain-containing protein [Deltaproteobacteria bacterium]MBN2673377.1 fibronectin type III domain-containing protein [Deltaproteobacteria bacterium]